MVSRFDWVVNRVALAKKEECCEGGGQRVPGPKNTADLAGTELHIQKEVVKVTSVGRKNLLTLTESTQDNPGHVSNGNQEHKQCARQAKVSLCVLKGEQDQNALKCTQEL